MTTAFVLSGGGSLGSIQAGMLLALAEHDIEPDLLVGTSVGAVNAAWLAGHPVLAGAHKLTSVRCGAPSDAPISSPRARCSACSASPADATI